MARVEVTAEESAYIAARIAAYASEHPDGSHPGNPFGMTALLLYGDVGGVIGIRPDGELVLLEHDVPATAAKPLDEPFWVRLAIATGSKHYPQLRYLVPKRPVDALTCEECQGTGTMRGHPNVICCCGGVGWIDEHRPK